jgi:NAD+ synthase (glutamine-hydrolysing)
VHLPNYGVFDEQRYFQAGSCGAVLDLSGHRVGLTVCEDIWEPGPPATDEAMAGATLILNISASPYHAGKGAERERMFAQRARDNIACAAFCGLVGGQDELVFDGHSFVVDHTGQTIARAEQFREELLLCEVDLEWAASARLREATHRTAERAARSSRGQMRVEVLPPLESPAPGAARFSAAHSPAVASAGAGATGPPVAAKSPPLQPPIAPLEAEVYAALTLGLYDYVEKNRFQRVVLGLSGGIDSALVACLAADALGSERVSVTIMPSRYSSSSTQEDARALAAALGVRTHELPIEQVVNSYASVLREQFAGRASDLTEENLQARIRGNLLMALSNKFGWLVLTTGNKSEMSVGYTTLYGDLAGGFAVIKDVPKTLVYRLCTWRNTPAGATGDRTRAPIPASIIERAPSAELRPDQRDQDSLPPYELLDRILYGYIELDQGREQLIAQGLPAADVERTIRMVDLAEYKRRQAPPGIKVTERAFGRDRRMPITNRYQG